MAENNYSRRDFLKRFAALSSVSLLFGLNAGCGSDPRGTALYGPPKVAYGPPPAGPISGIYFADSGGNLAWLYGYQSVPTNSTFVFKFTADMNTSAPAAVSLIDGSNNQVALNPPTWEGALTLSVTPSVPLASNTDYTLSLTDATDASGTKITISPGATAVFKTAAA